jgi:flagellar biosynthesis/type III secretory pathway M-ring protein FliF/YscJ
MGTLGLETATGPAGAKARDTLLVVTAKFDKEYQKKAEQQLAAAPMQRWVQGWMMAIFEFISPKLIGTVFLLVIAMMLLKWMGKGAKRAAAVFQTAPGGAMIVEAQGKFVDRPRSPEQGTEEEPVAELQVKSDKAVEAVGRFAKERPEAMALLLKGWMSRD